MSARIQPNTNPDAKTAEQLAVVKKMQAAHRIFLPRWHTPPQR
jgi:hypothetical protein